MVGMMLHQDASNHAWLPGDARQYDLMVTLDDATSAIYSAFLVEEEGTASSFRGLGEVIARHGLFCALYTDRGSHYFHTPEAGAPVYKTAPTQVGRALAQLGIEHIAAYSPEARGRSERAFRTLQDRLPKELRLAGDHRRSRPPTAGWPRPTSPPTTRQFAVAAEQAGSAFVRRYRRCLARDPVHPGDPPGRQRQHRQMAEALLATPAEPAAAALRQGERARARISRRRLAVFLGPNRLADYDARGSLVDDKTKRGVTRFHAGRFGSRACPGPKPKRSGQLASYINRPT